MDIAFSIILTAILILGNGYFSMSEMALVNARRARLEQAEDEGDKKASKALELQRDEDSLLSTIQVAITLIGFGASAAATATLSEPLAGALQSLDFAWLSAAAPALSVVIITLIVSYFTLVFGELIPKRIALANPEKVAKRVAGTVANFQKAARPLVKLLAVSTGFVAKVFKIESTEDRNEVSEEEIKYMVSEQETLLDEEKRMIHEIFDLGDTIAREVLVPRVDMTMVEDTSTLGETLDLMSQTGYSRLPVYHEDYDRIVGIAHIKDLIVPVIDGEQDKIISEFMRDAVFVPDTKDILPLLSEMQTAHQQMVVVVDEYGGTAGLITIEDIVEEIVGEIEDEFDPDNKYLTRLADGEWLIDGRFPIDDAMELGFPIENTDEYETMAGWLLDINDSLPQIGDILNVDGWRFKVQSMRGRRIALIRVKKPDEPVIPEEPEEDDQSEKRLFKSDKKSDKKPEKESESEPEEEDESAQKANPKK